MSIYNLEKQGRSIKVQSRGHPKELRVYPGIRTSPVEPSESHVNLDLNIVMALIGRLL